MKEADEEAEKEKEYDYEDPPSSKALRRASKDEDDFMGKLR